MKRSWLLVSFIVGFSVVLLSSVAAFSQLPPGIPRHETVMIDQIFRYSVTNNFNLWTPGAGSTPTRQGLVCDTLWYIDQQTGEWINALAKEPPIYSEDFSKMSVKLRKGIYWSDGVEFTADDVVFTVKNLKSHPAMMWGTELELYVEDVHKVDDYTVVFELTKPYSRFHNVFTARYYAVYIMPKHIWEKVEKPMEFTFYPPVSLGPYILKDADSAGYWELFERREDWERTSVGKVTGMPPAPKYFLTIFYGPSEKKVMAMSKHELDLFMNVDYEAFKSLLEKDSYARSWYKDYPWAWPDELDGRRFGFNLEKFPYHIKDVRWALALALDIVDLQTEYLGGVTRVTPIPQPATPFHMKNYHKPLEPWLREFKIEAEEGVYFKPYDETVPYQIAEWAKKQGYSVPSEPEDMKDMFGVGWWKHAPDVSEKLLKKHGFKRNAQGKWLLPDGTLWKFKIIAAPDEVDVFRLALGAVDQWREFGIEVEVSTLERDPYYTSNSLGDFTCTSAWGGAYTATAVLDKWPFIYSFHSKFYRPTGERSVSTFTNSERIKSEELDRLIDEMEKFPPNDPKTPELVKEFMKLWVENMWSICTVSFKKFVTQDEYYWTHFPTADDPYGQPCYWFMGGRFILPHLKATGRK